MSLLTTKRVRLYATALIFLYVVLAGRFTYESIFDKPRVCDFGQYWAAGLLALDGKAVDAYDRDKLHAVERKEFGDDFPNLHFNYPPTYLLLQIPFSLLPYLAALILFIALNVYCFWRLVRAIVAQVNSEYCDVAGRVALAFPGVILNVSYGQNGIFSALLLGTGLFVVDSSPLLAGLLFGLLSYKPNLAVVAPIVLLITKRWRAFGATVLTGAIFMLLTLPLFGLAPWYAFAGRLSAVFEFVEKHPEILYRYSTYFGTFKLAGLPTVAASALQTIISLASLGVLIWLWRKECSNQLRCAGTICCCLLMTPYAIEYDLAMLGLAIGWYVAHTLKDNCEISTFERTVLVLAWAIPFFGRHIARVSQVVTAPFVVTALLLMIMRRVYGPSQSQS